jgi:putative NADH-flavin reductase
VTTVAMFGGGGFAGGAIRDELVRRGHSVISVTRSGEAAQPVAGVETRQGSVHDPDLVEALAAEADALVVAIPARAVDGASLSQAIPSLSRSAAAHGARLGIVGGAGSSLVTEGGPRLLDGAEFPDAYKSEALGQVDVLTALRDAGDGADWFVQSPAALFGSYANVSPTGSYRTGGDVMVVNDNGESQISGEDFAMAFADELEHPSHHGERYTVGQ